MVIPTYEEIESYNTKSGELDKKINAYLRENDYASLYSLLDNKETQLLTYKNQRAYMLRIITQLIKYEIDSTGNTSFEGRNTSEIIRIYKNISMYLRRIEFNFPIDLQKRILIYMREEKVSIELVIGIIMNNTKIVHRKEIINKLSELIGEENE